MLLDVLSTLRYCRTSGIVISRSALMNRKPSARAWQPRRLVARFLYSIPVLIAPARNHDVTGRCPTNLRVTWHRVPRVRRAATSRPVRRDCARRRVMVMISRRVFVQRRLIQPASYQCHLICMSDCIWILTANCFYFFCFSSACHQTLWRYWNPILLRRYAFSIISTPKF